MMPDIISAQALLELAHPSYDSKIEELWASAGHIYIEEFFKTKVIRSDYKPITFNLPGKIKYTPDFWHILSGGKMIICEIKNSPKNKGYQTTLNKLKTAQALFPYFTYIIVFAELGWEIRQIGEMK